jgi:LPS-assembly protein
MKKIFTLLNILIVILITDFAHSKDIFSDFKTNTKTLSIHLYADYIEYLNNYDIIAKNNVKIISDSYQIYSNEILYNVKDEEIIFKSGLDAITKDDLIVKGSYAIYKIQPKELFINDIIFNVDENVFFAKYGEKNNETIKIVDANYTSCPFCETYKPLWLISSKSIVYDKHKKEVFYKHAVFKIKGFPVFYVPYFSHPTSKAQGRSGILVPKIGNKYSLGVPIYYRQSSVTDYTFTPSIFSNMQIYDFQARHLSKNADMFMETSILPKIYNNKANVNNKTVQHYYINGGYKYSNQNLIAGSKIVRGSETAYLKNYLNVEEPSLASKIYLHKHNMSNYYKVEMLSFQGLNAEHEVSESSVTPYVFLRHKTAHNNNIVSTLFFTSYAYKTNDNQEMKRALFKAKVNKGTIFESGVKANVGFSIEDTITHISNDELISNEYQSVVKNNNNIHFNIDYPLFNKINNYYVVISPSIKGFASNIKYDYLFIQNDYEKNLTELSEHNLFSPENYNDLFFPELLNFVSYGFDINVFNKDLKYDVFMGQLSTIDSHKNFAFNKKDYFFNNIVEYKNLLLNYRSSRFNNSLKPKLEEVYATIIFAKTNLFYNYFFYNESMLSKKFLESLFNEQLTYAKQHVIGFSYNISDNWKIKSDNQFDNKIASDSLLKQSFVIEYDGPCLKLEIKFDNIRVKDSKRGIKRNNIPSIRPYLKGIN